MTQEPNQFTRTPMYEQLRQVPALIRDKLQELDDLVKARLEARQVLRWERIFTAGCGDSFYVGLAAELALERWAGVPVEPFPSMQFARYALPQGAAGSALFAISNSGRVVRTIEAATLARRAGLDTIALTSHPQSPLARETQNVLGIELPQQGFSPGICGYVQALLLLYLTALHLGELRGCLSQDEGLRLREQIRGMADLWEEALKRIEGPIRQLAEALKGEELLVFVGSGPSYATALFSAAKVVEACGVTSLGQDFEEWAHIQFFYRREGVPTFLIAPPGASLSRAYELVSAMKGVGARTVGVMGEGEELASQVECPLMLSGRLPEELSPLLYALPGGLFAYYLSEAKGEIFFRMDRRVDRVGPILRSRIHS